MFLAIHVNKLKFRAKAQNEHLFLATKHKIIGMIFKVLLASLINNAQWNQKISEVVVEFEFIFI